ncbi:unnamed protein product [Linum tenue]|uniref:DUF7054 domain-containing protein n=1 Tax=Linum tenue TaxID=586396 RepID=A0AAV0IM94_9ROSI|nr:unnamed protein product [Linum tenue]
MSSTGKINRRGPEPTEKTNNNRKNRVTERAVSFHGGKIAEQIAPPPQAEARMQRPKTLPNLLAGRNMNSSSVEIRPLKLTKLLLNVTVQGSVGAVQMLVSPESTVGELIAAVIRQYNKEGRRPVIATDPSRFGLHYSQFSLESLDRAEKLQELGSRNFFMCQRKAAADSGSGAPPCSSSSSCSNEVEKAAARSGFPWLKFIDFRQ